jgi:hypothetical protein
MECEEKMSSGSREKYTGEGEDASLGPWCYHVAVGM